MPLPSAFQGVQACPTATCPCHLFFRRFKIAVCPASNPPNPPNASAGLQGNNSYIYTCPCHLFFRGFKTAVCLASNPPNSSNPPVATTLTSIHAPAIRFSGGSRLPFARLRRPLFARPQTLQTLRRPPRQQLLQLHAPAICFSRGSSLSPQGNNSYSYIVCPASNHTLRRPPRQQLLQLHAPEHLCQLHAPAIYMLLLFARPQTLQTDRKSVV